MSARVTDINIGVCDHGKKCCPHNITGMIIKGSPSTMLNGLPGVRFGDLTMSSCPHCGGAGGFCVGSTPKNRMDGVPGHKKGDMVVEPAGTSFTITGSPNCFDG